MSVARRNEGRSKDAESQQTLPQRSPRAQRTRTRQGCERCRTQRRKCDEQKPGCRRCVNAGVECSYVRQISFLQHKSKYLPIEAGLNQAGAPARATYASLQFVIDPSVDDAPKAADTLRIDKDDGIQDEMENAQPGMETVSQHIQLPIGERHVERAAPEHVSEAPTPATQSVNNGPRQIIGETLNKHWLPPAEQCLLVQDDIRLLRHYIHYVAPWLDVYDQNRTFGVAVPRFAMYSPSVMNAVLQLSASSSGLPVSPAGLRGAGASYLMALSIEPIKRSPLSILGIVTHFVLLRVKQYIENVPETWVGTFHGGRIPLDLRRDDFADVCHRKIWQGSFALMARLEIAHALMFETAPSISSDLFRELLLPSDNAITEHSDSSNILATSLHCLALLGDVMTLCFPPSNEKETSPGEHPARAQEKSHPGEWTALLSKLWEWYANRPLEMQPLAEIDRADQDTPFPTILFTSPVGISVNISYHAAMCLLLSRWPPKLSLFDSFIAIGADLAQISPDSHIHRLCGIAINSDPAHPKCWDPCTIAAFSMAARSMRMPNQRNEILSCLNQVRKAGWRIDGLVRKLREEWT